jgi:hypothetical protein
MTSPKTIKLNCDRPGGATPEMISAGAEELKKYVNEDELLVYEPWQIVGFVYQAMVAASVCDSLGTPFSALQPSMQTCR